MAIVNGLCALYANDHTWSLFLLVFLGPFLINRSIYASIAFIHHFWWLFYLQMQLIRFIEGDQGDRLVVDELLADVLFSSAIYLVLQTSQHTSPCVEHFVKLRVCGVCTTQQQLYSFSKLLCLRCTYHSTTVSFLFSKFLWTWRTYHSWEKPECDLWWKLHW